MRKGLLFIFALLSAAAFAVEWEDETVIGINKVDPFAGLYRKRRRFRAQNDAERQLEISMGFPTRRRAG